MTSAQQIALWADKLRDISAFGLLFTDSNYDSERYRQIQDLAIEMMAAAAGEPIEDIEPLRAAVFNRPTPFSTGDGAVIDNDGRILLIRRADNGMWALPGGALEVGETPAAGTVREVLEETGVSCEAVKMVGVFDSRLCGSVTRHHLYHFVFLCKPLDGHPVLEASHAHEVLGMNWYTQEALPEDIDPGHVSRIPVAFQVWKDHRPAFFDR